MSKMRLVLAEDQTLLRHSLRALISDESDMEVVGEAAGGEEAVRLVESLRPDAVVMDLSLPGMDGVEAARAIKLSSPGVRVLMLSVHETRSQIRRALQAGASGYVIKRSAAEELIQALRAVRAGGLYLDPIVASKLMPPSSPPAAAESAGVVLSDREEAVLRLIARGYANKEIAARLGLSIKTVETFKSRAMLKLGLDSRVGLVRYASGKGWLNSDGGEW